MLPSLSKSGVTVYREPQSERERHFYRAAIRYLHERLDKASLEDARRAAIEEMRYHDATDPVAFVNDHPALWFSLLSAVASDEDRVIAEERIWSILRRDNMFGRR